MAIDYAPARSPASATTSAAKSARDAPDARVGAPALSWAIETACGRELRVTEQRLEVADVRRSRSFVRAESLP